MGKTLTGIVSSDKTDKTIVVSIQTRKTHPLYKKQFTITKRFMAHDEKNEAKSGDKVIIKESRPLSARKRYILYKITDRPIIREQQSVEAVTEEPIVEKQVSKKKSDEKTKIDTKKPSDEVSEGKQ